MSLAIISGKVSAITNGSEIGNFASRTLFGNSSFLRNDERGIDKVSSAISNIQNILTDLSGAAGVKNNMYVIGRYEEDEKKDFLGRLVSPVTNAYSRAVSYWGGGKEDQTGVIIDGFDNFKGDLGVALANQPVMFSADVTDHRVRTPNTLTMRVYVDLVHSDDVVQNIMQSVANSLGGLGGTLLNAISGNTLNRAQKALSGLQWIQENGKAFKVYTPHKVYENMMIERIAPINDQKMNEILAADITFKEIIYCKPLGSDWKNPARLAPSNSSRQLASVAGWLSF